MDPYATSYVMNYGKPPQGNKSASADRPVTSRGYRASYELSGGIGRTQFDDEFCARNAAGAAAQPIRSGTSSGARKNNPHPDQVGVLVTSY